MNLKIFLFIARSDVFDGIFTVNSDILSTSDPFEWLEVRSTVRGDTDDLVFGVYHICLTLRAKYLW